MSTAVPFTVKCDRWEECKARHDEVVKWLGKVDERQREDGKTLAALNAKVAAYAAMGSVAGGVVVAIVSRFMR